MKRICLAFAAAIIAMGAQAQATWSNDIAQIMYDNCTNCHRDGGIAPFALVTYEEATDDVSDIAEAVQTGYMPPWSADLDYQNYTHERVLETEDMLAIIEWIGNGTPEGNPDDAPPPPIYPEDGFISATPDLELQMEPYASQASAFSDDYVCISIPMELATAKKLRAFEVVPGNPEIVHHCLLFVDESGDYQSDFSGTCVGPTDGLIGGYTPGAVPTVFPSDGELINMGVTVPAGSNLVLTMHYPEGSFGQVDDTKVRLYFYEDNVTIREILTDPIIQNWNFSLPANEITDVSAEWNLIPEDVSLLSVFPHMHLLGKDIKSYGVTLADDTIPFINIPHWDFEWQQFYGFQNIIHVPAWTSIKGEGSFDNTVNNPHNPNDPPINVFPGLNTADEMFLVYFQFLGYEDGDELIDLEELTSLPTFIEEQMARESGIQVSTYPNPFTESILLELIADEPSTVSLSVYDNQGKLVEILAQNQKVAAGNLQWQWTPKTDLPGGVYHYSMKVNGQLTSGMLLKK
jgi:hypothetical protein